MFSSYVICIVHPLGSLPSISSLNWIGVLICFPITPSKESLSILSPIYAHLAATLMRSHFAFQNSISLSLLAKEIIHSLRKWSTWNSQIGIERGDYILRYESHIHVNWKPNANLTMNNNNLVILKGTEVMVQCLKVHHVFGMLAENSFVLTKTPGIDKPCHQPHGSQSILKLNSMFFKINDQPHDHTTMKPIIE